jgi:hypothetical protein
VAEGEVRGGLAGDVEPAGIGEGSHVRFSPSGNQTGHCRAHAASRDVSPAGSARRSDAGDGGSRKVSLVIMTGVCLECPGP